MLSDGQFSSYARPNYSGLRRPNSWTSIGVFFDTRDGFGLCDPWNVAHVTSESSLLIRVNGHKSNMLQPMAEAVMNLYGVVFAVESEETLGGFDHWHRHLVLSFPGWEPFHLFRRLKLLGLRTLMPSAWYERFTYKQPQFVQALHKIESRTPEWVVWTVGDCPNTGSKLESLANEGLVDKMPIESLTELYLMPPSDIPEPSRVAQAWKMAVGGPIIPFDKNMREQITTGLDEAFGPHLAEWVPKGTGVRRRL